MLLLGIACIVLGVAAVVAAVLTSAGTAELVGLELGALPIFLVGLVSGALVLWGLTLSRLGARREIRTRREHRRLTKLAQQRGEEPDRPAPEPGDGPPEDRATGSGA